ncbi:hypothetical protein QYE76_028389 [Lolium multiflorum]|uniref:BHLH domain-containing protein n=1 Tax=Lolium multiflorum TaxID=4521 RepID=A0AAD8VGY5_LOLMU|nr:hypothetical protein QYE76_028389 [Lolium multiflorum]
MPSYWDDLTANFHELSALDHHSSDDLYELVAKGAGLAISAPHVHRHEVQLRVPPSEEEMARWLHPIIKQGHAHASLAPDDRVTSMKESNLQLARKLDKKLPTMEKNLAVLSNQASTLDQTIQYLRSLQHQVQAMSVPVSPGVHVRPTVVLGAPPPMVPFGPMIPSLMMQAPVIYRPTAASDVAHARLLGGYCHGRSSTMKDKTKKSSLRQSG